jgi:hypothetical protein
VSSYDINEQRQLIQHIDIVVGSGDLEKSKPNPTVMRGNDFKNDGRMFDAPL